MEMTFNPNLEVAYAHVEVAKKALESAWDRGDKALDGRDAQVAAFDLTMYDAWRACKALLEMLSAERERINA